MKTRYLLLLIPPLLAGCFTWDPGVHEIPAPEGERVAVELTRMYLARVHGDLPEHTGQIIWTDDLCIPIDWRGETGCPAGAYYNGNQTIYVVWNGSLGRSALAHELVHYWIDEQQGFSDGEHLHLSWWYMVPPIKGNIIRWEESVWEERGQ